MFRFDNNRRDATRETLQKVSESFFSITHVLCIA